MYAVIKSGGKQYRVAPGDTIKVEKLPVSAGEKIELSEVLLLADEKGVKIGTPLVAGAKVTAEVKGQGRGPKVKVVKFKRRKHYRRENGHRQSFTELSITGITAK